MRENADLKQQVSQLQRTNNSLVDKARSQEKFNHSLVYEAEAVTEDMKALQEDNKRLRQQFSSLQRVCYPSVLWCRLWRPDNVCGSLILGIRAAKRRACLRCGTGKEGKREFHFSLHL